jgi:hypothetical protein
LQILPSIQHHAQRIDTPEVGFDCLPFAAPSTGVFVGISPSMWETIPKKVSQSVSLEIKALRWTFSLNARHSNPAIPNLEVN